MSRRILRINELLKRRLSELIARDVSGEGNLITVYEVITSLDLREAKVYVSILGPRPEDKLVNLKKKAPDFYKILRRELDLKFLPKIIFTLDQPDETIRIEKLLEQI